MFLTIFTPTYNRAPYLINIYQSLQKQTYKDFEWVIVDDGSKDNTREIIDAFIKENQLSIRYFYQPNQGKHIAINTGVSKAKGTLFMIVDSDDDLPHDSIAIVFQQYQKIKDNLDIAGVAGYMAHRNGEWIGKGLNFDILDVTSIDFRYKYEVWGDMMEVFRTNVLKEYPFPQITNEKFCPEIVVWNRIAKKYKLRFFHQVIYFRDYLEGGLTDNIIKIRMKSPIASMICYSELIQHPIPWKYKVKTAINYWRFRFCSTQKEVPKLSLLWIWTKPLGWVMHRRDLKKINI